MCKVLTLLYFYICCWCGRLRDKFHIKPGLLKVPHLYCGKQVSGGGIQQSWSSIWLVTWMLWNKCFNATSYDNKISNNLNWSRMVACVLRLQVSQRKCTHLAPMVAAVWQPQCSIYFHSLQTMFHLCPSLPHCRIQYLAWKWSLVMKREKHSSIQRIWCWSLVVTFDIVRPRVGWGNKYTIYVVSDVKMKSWVLIVIHVIEIKINRMLSKWIKMSNLWDFPCYLSWCCIFL